MTVSVCYRKQYDNFLTFSLLFLDILSEVLKVYTEVGEEDNKGKWLSWKSTYVSNFQSKSRRQDWIEAVLPLGAVGLGMQGLFLNYFKFQHYPMQND